MLLEPSWAGVDDPVERIMVALLGHPTAPGAGRKAGCNLRLPRSVSLRGKLHGA